MKPKTHVLLILDKSGSMSSRRDFAVGSYNEQIQALKEKMADQDILCSLLTFTTLVTEHFWARPAADLEEASLESYEPSGTTALYDAIGYGARKLSESANGHSSDTAYLIIVITDGEENASTHISESALAELTAELMSRKNWTFTMLGCSSQYLQNLGKTLSIPVANLASVDFSNPMHLNSASRLMRMASDNYLSARSSGQKAQSCFYTDTNAKSGDDAVFAAASALPLVAGATSHVQSDMKWHYGTEKTFQVGNKVRWKE